MSDIVGFKNEFGRVLAYTTMLEKHATKMKLTPLFKGDPEADELREVIEGEVEKPAKKTPTRKSIVNK